MRAGYTDCAVKRLHAAVLFVLGLAVAGALSGTVIADVTTSTGIDDDRGRRRRPSRRRPRRRRRRPLRRPANSPGRRAGRRRAGRAGCHPPMPSPPSRPPSPGRCRSSSTATLLLDPTRVALAYAADCGRQGAHRHRGDERPARRLGARRGICARGSRAIRSGSTRTPVDATLKFRNAKPVIQGGRAGRRAQHEGADSRASLAALRCQHAAAGASPHARRRAGGRRGRRSPT